MQSPVVRFTPIGREAAALPNETLLDVARRAAVPLGNSCGGIGVCSRCLVRVVAGGEQLSEPTTVEAPRIRPGERLACQAAVRGPCEITTTYW